MKIFSCEQYSDEWWAVRRGVPTASEFSSVLTPATMKLSKAADTYICRLIGDRFDLSYPRIDRAVTDAMRRGTEAEPKSRDWYEMERACDVQQVGFVLSECGRFGCSPDGLVGADGGLELKNPTPATQVAWLLDGILPAEHKCQVHGCLAVTGRAWWDFLSYSPGLPPLLVRVTPDEFTLKLKAALEVFHARYLEVLHTITRMGATTEAVCYAAADAMLAARQQTS